MTEQEWAVVRQEEGIAEEDPRGIDLCFTGSREECESYTKEVKDDGFWNIVPLSWLA